LPVIHFRSAGGVAIATFVVLAPLGCSLSGCVAAAIGGGAVAGYSVFAENLSPGQQVRDVAIATTIKQSWGAFNQDLAYRLDATVFDGRVLITGRVPSRRWRDEAVRRAWRVAGVRRVFDETEIGPDTHFIDSARDSWITAELRGELVADVNVKSINYTVKTSDGVLYLMGFARNRAELNIVIGHARTIAGVRRVVSFVRLLGSPEVNVPPPTPPPAEEEPAPPAQPRSTITVQPLN
jgi:osmotically-inducible protein OsmY